MELAIEALADAGWIGELLTRLGRREPVARRVNLSAGAVAL